MTKEDNPFELYVEEVNEEELQKAKIATDAFLNTWEEFARKWRQLQETYRKEGASDTAAREAMANWIQEQTEGPMWDETREESRRPENEPRGKNKKDWMYDIPIKPFDLHHNIWEMAKKQADYQKQLEEENKKLNQQLDFWIERAQEGGTIGGDGICGVSSNNLSLVASGVREEPHPREYPRDDSDWMRCKRTIQRMEDPEWLIRILQKFPSKEGWNNFKVDLIRTTADQLEKAHL